MFKAKLYLGVNIVNYIIMFIVTRTLGFVLSKYYGNGNSKIVFRTNNNY